MAQQQSSRLHRLLTLLDTGSTQATRFTAARQIGDIAKSHPQELTSLLKKVSQYLRSRNWDTRVAAAHAIGAIAENVKHASVNELFACIQSKMCDAGISAAAEDMVALPMFDSNIAGTSFRSFDLSKVLEFGALLASRGQEYDVANDNTKNPRERLAHQKQTLRRRLGLDICEQFMDMNDMIKDEDLILHNSHGNGINPRVYTSRNIQQLVANMVPSVLSKRPSPRELNLLKRKAKINSKDQSKGWSEDGDMEVACAQSMTTPKGSYPDSFGTNKESMDFDHDEENFEQDGDGRWPFHIFVEQLILDMFDPVWEVRHGGVMALREILTHQGASAGVVMPDLSLDDALFADLESKWTSQTMKRNREIDLNVQVPIDEFGTMVKKPKFEDVSCPFLETMISASKDENVDISMQVEDGGCNLPSEQGNGQLCFSSLKVEPELYPCEQPVCTTELKCEASSQKLDLLRSLTENNELMNLVKLVRHSWLKNCEFLQDCAIRFLCVLSLDRFGDYVSDQVVAPVRETCAQALGVVFKYMHPTLVHETLNILLKMQCRPEWEIRHGSLLGIKYLVAVRKEMLLNLLDRVLPACKAGLEDPDDDVRAVAADALIPTASAIVALKGQTLHSVVMLLWDILLDLDDLSPSTSSVMNLLAEIYSQEEMIPKIFEPLSLKENLEFDLNELGRIDDAKEGIISQDNPFMLSTLAPRLWPFMRHSITSVRYSAIRTLERLLEAGYRRNISEHSNTSFWPSFILGDTLRIVFQNLLLESNDEILKHSERVWRLLVQQSVSQQAELLHQSARSHLSAPVSLNVGST